MKILITNIKEKYSITKINYNINEKMTTNFETIQPIENFLEIENGIFAEKLNNSYLFSQEIKNSVSEQIQLLYIFNQNDIEFKIKDLE